MPIPKAITRFNRNYLNKALIRLAGRGSFVDLEHVGRRSGRVMHTPLMAFRPEGSRDTVTIALTYGPNVDWLKNITRAGRCRMRMGDSLLHLGAPTVIPPEVGVARMPQPQRTLLERLIKIEHFIELPVLAEEPW